MAVRAGDEILGSIWAIVQEPLTESRARTFSDSAKLVALHMLHQRADANVKRRIHADMLSTALEGGPGAAEALSRLGLARHPIVLLALSTQIMDGDKASPRQLTAEATASRQRLSDTFGVHLGASDARSVSALIGDIAYGIVPVSAVSDEAQGHARAVATDFLRRVGGREGVIAVGPVVADTTGLARARSATDRILRVLHSKERTSEAVVADLEDVYVESLLLEMRDIIDARADTVGGPITHLQAYDATHGGNLLRTLEAWLESHGDVRKAAAGVHVHPNTFRYRLKRLGEVSGLDLDDPDSRFAAMLQLRLIGKRYVSGL
ncbi:PucR C-terminal helix-turn-helix domain-containing protein [Streptomyces sp. MnatMP-M27]|nr:PucR C-terminal helix-turn-helix domain-containing protein [Streptomyces sp. MnatMP-M27]